MFKNCYFSKRRRHKKGFDGTDMGFLCMSLVFIVIIGAFYVLVNVFNRNRRQIAHSRSCHPLIESALQKRMLLSLQYANLKGEGQ